MRCPRADRPRRRAAGRVTAPHGRGAARRDVAAQPASRPTRWSPRRRPRVLLAGVQAVVDFRPRRTHGVDAAMQSRPRALAVGAAGTSNWSPPGGAGASLSAARWPTRSYMSYDDRTGCAFEAFARVFPGSVVLLIDTYDTVEGARRAAEVARAGRGGLSCARSGSTRATSGALAARPDVLDDAGYDDVRSSSAGGLDEHGSPARGRRRADRRLTPSAPESARPRTRPRLTRSTSCRRRRTGP